VLSLEYIIPGAPLKHFVVAWWPSRRGTKAGTEIYTTTMGLKKINLDAGLG